MIAAINDSAFNEGREMKRLEILGLLALTATALLVFAPTASATALTSGGSVYTGAIEGANGEERFSLEDPFGGNVECDSSIKAKVESHGAGVPVGAGISQLAFENCTGGWTVTANSTGSLKIHKLSPGGFPTWFGLTVTLSDHFGGSCSYVLKSPIGGLFYPSSLTGATAKLEMALTLEYESGGMLCSKENYLLGQYILGTPDDLNIH